MGLEIFQDLSLRECGDVFINGREQGAFQVVFTYCSVEYSGRGKSTLDEGERMVLWKPDGNFQIHSDEGYEPVNYQPTGADITARYSDEEEILQLISTRSNPDEEIEVSCETIYAVIQYDMKDTAELQLSGTEKDMQMAILHNPALIEDGFTVQDYEYELDVGAVDIFGYDSSDTPVIVEIKRRKAQIKHIDQLLRYINWYKTNVSQEVRGILVAPDMTETVADEIVRNRLEYIELDPLEI